MGRAIGALVVIIGVVVGITMSNRSETVLEFNDLVVEIHGQTSFSGDEMVLQFEQLGEVTPQNVTEYRTLIDGYKRVVESARTELMQVEVPDHRECHDLHGAIAVYFDLELSVVDAYHTVFDAVESNVDEATIEAHWAALDRLGSQEESEIRRIQNLQRVMGEKFDFELRH